MATSKKGYLIIFSAHSGGGKGTIIKQIMKKFDNLTFSISMTTRPKRKGERNGKGYYFITEEKFKEHIKKGDFLEYALVHNKFYYGTPKKPIEEALKKGQHIIFDIDIKGFQSISKLFPKDQIISFFIKTPTLEEAKRRLLLRGRDTIDEIEQRMETAKEELKFEKKYDHIIINDDLDTAIEEIENILTNS